MNHVLDVKEVGFSHPNHAVLRSATFQARSYEFLALLGTNGAGKSTLLDILAGLRKPHSGKVSVDGRDQKLWSQQEIARRVSHLPQAVHTDLPFTAEQLVAMGRYPHMDRWFESEEDHHQIESAMQRTQCWQYRQRIFGSLSGGERQRVLLAACLAQDASTLLLDEPSTFLDIEQQLHCFSVLRAEAERGKVCLAVTHDFNLALTHCTRLLVLADGEIAYDLQASHAHEHVEWLRLFSPRLRMELTADGKPWIRYQ